MINFHRGDEQPCSVAMTTAIAKSSIPTKMVRHFQASVYRNRSSLSFLGWVATWGGELECTGKPIENKEHKEKKQKKGHPCLGCPFCFSTEFTADLMPKI